MFDVQWVYKHMTMKKQRGPGQPSLVTVGFAADDRHGIAYALVGSGGRGSLVRVGFACRPLPALRGRDVAYFALDAIAAELHERGFNRVDIHIDDEYLPADLAQRRPVPSTLTVPYVSLRCKLNRFRDATVSSAGGAVARDLTARARAEVSLDIAA
jgi:hypothetical protein